MSPFTGLNGRSPVTQLHVDNSNQLAHVILYSVFLFLTTITVILRIWGRKIQKQALATNDYLILLGFVSSMLGRYVLHSLIPVRFLPRPRSVSISMVSTVFRLCTISEADAIPPQWPITQLCGAPQRPSLIKAIK